MHTAVILQAMKASGVVIRLDPESFLTLLRRTERPLIVVVPPSGILSKQFQYLTSYRGFAFYTRSRDELPLPRGAELIVAESIWIPG